MYISLPKKRQRRHLLGCYPTEQRGAASSWEITPAKAWQSDAGLLQHNGLSVSNTGVAETSVFPQSVTQAGG